MIFIEIIPSGIADIVRESIKHIAVRGRPVDDAVGYKAIDNAIIDSEVIASGLLGYVKPENLFFIFGEGEQFILDILSRPLYVKPPTNGVPCIDDEVYYDYDPGDNKYAAKNRAVVICKVEKTKLFQECGFYEEKNRGSEAKSYKITYSQFQGVKKYLAGSTNLESHTVPLTYNLDSHNDLHQPPRRDAQRKKRAAVRGQAVCFGSALPCR